MQTAVCEKFQCHRMGTTLKEFVSPRHIQVNAAQPRISGKCHSNKRRSGLLPAKLIGLVTQMPSPFPRKQATKLVEQLDFCGPPTNKYPAAQCLLVCVPAGNIIQS